MNLEINVAEIARTATAPSHGQAGAAHRRTCLALQFLSPGKPGGYVRAFVPVAALLIRDAAFLASSSVSKPLTAANFRPIICAIKKAILIPAAATFSAMA